MSTSHPVWCNFLFDLDGTLIDSSPLHDRAYRKALAAHRVDLITGFSYDTFKAKTTRDGFRSLGVADEQELAVLTADKQRHFRDAVASGELNVMTGATELLAELKHAGQRLFIVSSGSRRSVAAALEGTGLGQYFEYVITAEDVQRGKPAPDAFMLCLSQFGLTPTETIVVEDASAGITAAHAAGLLVIGVHDRTVERVADFFFPDFVSFRRWLARSQTEVGASR